MHNRKKYLLQEPKKLKQDNTQGFITLLLGEYKFELIWDIPHYVLNIYTKFPHVRNKNSGAQFSELFQLTLLLM